jgi:hypothetical protein
MAQCPCCGKIFEGERGAAIHLHYCPKINNYNVYNKEQVRHRRKEVEETFKSKLKWRMKSVNIFTTNHI